jgi:hypothetical protein
MLEAIFSPEGAIKLSDSSIVVIVSLFSHDVAKNETIAVMK